MKKLLYSLFFFYLLFLLTSCSSIADKEAIKNTITRIEADELDSAIIIMKNMSEKTLLSAKEDILNAVIDEVSVCLGFNNWIGTDYHLVDDEVINDLEKYQTIVKMLNLDADDSNVDDFIENALELKKYTKLNTYHSKGGAEDYAEITKVMSQAASCNTRSVANKYFQKAYDICMLAYWKFDGNADYGMVETADFYYQQSIQINAIIDQKSPTSVQNNEYERAHDEFKRLAQEHADSYNYIIKIVESFPRSLY